MRGIRKTSTATVDGLGSIRSAGDDFPISAVDKNRREVEDRSHTCKGGAT